MPAPKDPTLTHELLAKALGVTVTTVKSYRRKFPEFWRTESEGKPLRFPPESLALCRRIHHHFKRGLSVEETRKRLAKEFEAVAAPAQDVVSPTSAGGSDTGPGHDSLARVENLLEGLFTLQNRTHSLMAELLARLDTLADRMGPPLWAQAGTRSGPAQPRTTPAGPGQTGPIQAAMIRADQAREAQAPSGTSRAEPGQATRPIPAQPPTPPAAQPAVSRPAPPQARTDATGAVTGPCPPQTFLDMPVVVLSETGEFLGVTLKAEGPVTLARFETFLTDRAKGLGQIQARWLHQAHDPGTDRQEEWTLRIEQDSKASDHLFIQATTPKGNTVARFAALTVGGTPASEAVLQTVLRQVKESLVQ